MSPQEKPDNSSLAIAAFREPGEWLPFQVHRSTFAVPTSCVREWRAYGELSPIVEIPDSPPFVEGVVYLRGDIVPVVNLCSRLSTAQAGAEAKLVVVVLNQRDVALLVHEVGTTFVADRSEVLPPPGFHLDQADHFLRGLVRQAGGIVMLLDVQALLDGISPSLLGEPDLPALPGD